MVVQRRMIGETSLNRRAFLQGSGGAAAILALSTIAPGYVHAAQSLMIGDRELRVLSDGSMNLPLSFAFPDVPRDQVEALLGVHGISADPLTPDCNVTLLRDGDRVALFDAGAGPSFLNTTGRLHDSLSEAGISPESVTDVIFTHAHPDHLWGVLDDFDELVFPEAAYHISQTEWDFWRADDTLANMPEARKSFVVGAQNRFAVIEDKINLFAAGDEVFPGVEAVDTAGHTAGHTAFAVHGGSEEVMILGDAITNVIISFERPDWPTGSDHDADKGAETRAALLDRLAASKARVIGFHLPYPGTGRVERKGAQYRFASG